jgi:hypothetical protein
MKIKCAATLAALVLCGCGTTINVATSPDTYRLEPANLAGLRASEPIAVLNGWPVASTVKFADGHDLVVADERQLSETAVVMLTRGLAARGIATGGTGKSVTLTVRGESFRTQNQVRPVVRLSVHARLGDGTAFSVPAQNRSPVSTTNAFEGAILFALVALVNDERFVKYVNAVR